MNKFSTLTASVLAVTLSLTGCGGDDSSSSDIKDPQPTVPAKQTSLTGVITDEMGNPIADATLKIDGESLTTNNDGRYSVDLDSSEDTKVVLIKKAGYLTTAREIAVAKTGQYMLDVQLSTDQVTTAFDTSAGITDLPVSGAKVSIPPESVVDAEGKPYTGTVNLAANYYNPDSIAGAQAFAQPFKGQDKDGNNETNLVTVGVIDVKMTDTNGDPLDLKEGSTATLTFPEASTDQDLASIPLWYYDEDELIWVKDGVAVRQSDGSYQGEVTHFTLWNVDIPVTNYYATVEGCVVDAETQKPYNNLFGAILEGRGYFNYGSIDNQGRFKVLVPPNTPLTLSPEEYFVNFDTVTIPALAQNETLSINGGACIEASPVSSDEDSYLIEFFNDQLPPTPVAPETPLEPSVPSVPFEPPVTENTSGVIGYIFDFETEYTDSLAGEEYKLDNVALTTHTMLDNATVEFKEEWLYENVDYEGYDFESVVLTPQGLSVRFSGTIDEDENLIGTSYNTVFANNTYTQSLSNGLLFEATFKDVSLSGQKIGTVLSLEDENDLYNDIPPSLVQSLNILDDAVSTFDADASCKKLVTAETNMDYIEKGWALPELSFEQAIADFNDSSNQGNWDGIEWIAEVYEEDDDMNDDLVAFLQFDDGVYAGFYVDKRSEALQDYEKDDCTYYNEAAKDQILEALSEAYPSL